MYRTIFQYKSFVPCKYTFRGSVGFRCGVTREERPAAPTAESYWALQGEQESVTAGLYFQERSISPSPCPDTRLLDDDPSLRSRIPSNPSGSRGLMHLRWIRQDRISPIPHDSSFEPLLGITKIDTIPPFQEITKGKTHHVKLKVKLLHFWICNLNRIENAIFSGWLKKEWKFNFNSL